MIQKTLFLIIIICFWISSPTIAQQRNFVDKDYRISLHLKDFFAFLITVGDFSENQHFKFDEYKNSFFVKKCIELYSSEPNILLVRFGSFGDHSDKYWGILTKKKAYMFYNEKDKDYKAFASAKDSATLEILTSYMGKMKDKNML